MYRGIPATTIVVIRISLKVFVNDFSGYPIILHLYLLGFSSLIITKKFE